MLQGITSTARGSYPYSKHAVWTRIHQDWDINSFLPFESKGCVTVKSDLDIV